MYKMDVKCIKKKNNKNGNYVIIKWHTMMTVKNVNLLHKIKKNIEIYLLLLL